MKGSSSIRRMGRQRRRKSIRRKVSGDAGRPRLSVFRSLKHTYAQLIDDVDGVTLVSASTLSDEVRKELGNGGHTKTDASKAVGKVLARLALENLDRRHIGLFQIRQNLITFCIIGTMNNELVRAWICADLKSQILNCTAVALNLLFFFQQGERNARIKFINLPCLLHAEQRIIQRDEQDSILVRPAVVSLPGIDGAHFFEHILCDILRSNIAGDNDTAPKMP